MLNTNQTTQADQITRKTNKNTSLVEMLTRKIFVYDGSKGAILMRMGLKGGEIADLWNIEHSDVVFRLHSEYIAAGADIIQTNTMQSNRYNLEDRGLYEKLRTLNIEGVRLAKAAVRDSGRECLVAASIGPLGGLMAPYGDMSFDEAVMAFSEQIIAVAEAEVDILHFETFTDLAELRAAIFAAKSAAAHLPIIATMSYGKNGRTIMGDDAYLSALYLKAAGVSCAGANCSLYPYEMLPVIQKMTAIGIHICAKPNADMDTANNDFYKSTIEFAAAGVRLIGGCCGAKPDHIADIRRAVDELADDGRAINEVIADDMLISPAQTIALNDARYAYSNKQVDEIDLNSTKSADDVISAMIEANEKEGRVCVISASAEEESEKKTPMLVSLTKHAAINAKVYLKKPLVFKTDIPEALEEGLRHYCGIAGVITPPGCDVNGKVITLGL